jgi:hypothetical protein
VEHKLDAIFSNTNVEHKFDVIFCNANVEHDVVFIKSKTMAGHKLTLFYVMLMWKSEINHFLYNKLILKERFLYLPIIGSQQ